MNRYSATIFENGSVLFKRKNNINNFANAIKKENWIRKLINEEFPYLSRKLYIKTLNRFFYKLSKLKIDAEHSVFLTLETANTMTFDEINKQFTLFAKNFKYKYNSNGYIKCVGCYKDGFDRFHIHSIFTFDGKIPTLNREWLKNHWKFGHIHIEYTWKKKEDGVLGYICKDDKNCLQEDNKQFTKYPQFAKFITTSHNFEKKKIQNQFDIDKDFFKSIMRQRTQIDSESRVNMKAHLYNNMKCVDGCLIYNADNLAQILNDSYINEEESC